MKKEVYRVLAFYPPLNQSAATNYWVAAGANEEELPTGFDPEDIAVFAGKEIRDGDVMEDGMAVVKITTTVPSTATLKKTVVDLG